jgi:menaquinone-dependent protoporphyrinogen oxidase
MSKKILVAYATKAGSTAEVADFIGKTLAEKGADVDVKPIKNISDITGYNAIIIGSPARAGKILSDATEFVERNKASLTNIPVAYFVTCTTLIKDTDDNRKIANEYLDSISGTISPVGKGLFAGKMDYSKIGFASTLILKYIFSTPEGDYRDWDAIKKWADDLFPKLIPSKI